MVFLINRGRITMAIRDWFKSATQRAVEAEAALPASYRAARRGEIAAYQAQRVHEELDAQTIAFTRSPEEAKAYAFALDLVRRRGPSEASRIADKVVFYVQMLSREPR
jgi:nitrogen fixation/metabolism regulation signal transduction histidine kinase